MNYEENKNDNNETAQEEYNDKENRVSERVGAVFDKIMPYQENHNRKRKRNNLIILISGVFFIFIAIMIGMFATKKPSVITYKENVALSKGETYENICNASVSVTLFNEGDITANGVKLNIFIASQDSAGALPTVIFIIAILVIILIIGSFAKKRNRNRNSAEEQISKIKVYDLSESDQAKLNLIILQKMDKYNMATIFCYCNYPALLDFAQDPQTLSDLRKAEYLSDIEFNYALGNNYEEFSDYFKTESNFSQMDDSPMSDQITLCVNQIFVDKLISFFADSYVSKIARFNESPKENLRDNIIQYKKLYESEKVSNLTQIELYYYAVNSGMFESNDLESNYTSFIQMFENASLSDNVEFALKKPQPAPVVTQKTTDLVYLSKNDEVTAKEPVKAEAEVNKIVEQPTVKKVVPKKIIR